ncbi:contractile injection system protein, VgrG/Pvc8 family [Orrella dioscoreae]|uniref:Gene D protein n=1 Tax=Orrella dioscoreae TaxID=1851544 RepID=A0A1C3K380_9BURK|nr:contractile injection system protein, VgrG/Pvc8 family [Orrella dioscoreae]SBT25963.1 Gene D protein [Orrella dioscoreae]SOE50884.1 Gene D protein [Orrella dioscoreae]
MTEAHRIPAYRVTLDGRDITGNIKPRLISLSITEARGEEADQLDIDIDDHDGAMELPARGVVLRVALGWKGQALVDKGTFTVDEVQYQYSPGRITLRARSADLTSPLRTRNERSFHGKAIGHIVATVAKDHGLQPVVGRAFANEKIAHIDQTNESDVAFLNRIGKRYDAVATVKDGRLLFLPVARGETASGQDTPLTVIALHANAGDNARFQMADRNSYTGVSAQWQGKGETKRRTVVLGAKGRAKRLKSLYGSEKDAMDAARAEWERIQRGAATFDMELVFGRPDLSPQGRLQVPDLKKPLDGYVWLIKRLVHKLGDNGLTTSIEGETADAGEDAEPREPEDTDAADDEEGDADDDGDADGIE